MSLDGRIVQAINKFEQVVREHEDADGSKADDLLALYDIVREQLTSVIEIAILEAGIRSTQKLGSDILKELRKV